MFKILLIAGHGDGDCGAVGNNYKESDLTREFAKLVKNEFKKFDCVCDIADDRYNYFTYLKKHKYNFKKYNYVLEIHFNAGGGYGCEVLLLPSTRDVATERTIVNNVCEYGQLRNRGLKPMNLYVLNKITAQGVKCSLLEVCFIDSQSDIQKYCLYKYQMAQAVAESFAMKYSISKKESNQKMEKRIDKINERLTALENRFAEYNYIDNNMPVSYKPTIKKLVENGYLKGNENGLALTEDMMRLLTILDRGGVFGK